MNKANTMHKFLQFFPRLARVLQVGFYVVAGELRRAVLALLAPDKARQLQQTQIARRQARFKLDPASTEFFTRD